MWLLELSHFLLQLSIRPLQCPHLLLQRAYPGSYLHKLCLGLMQLRVKCRQIACRFWRTTTGVSHAERGNRDDASNNDDSNFRFHNVNLG